MPLSSPVDDIGQVWRQDVGLGQPLVVMFFSKIFVPFCLQRTTNYPSGNVRTQLRMLYALTTATTTVIQIAAGIGKLLVFLSLSRAVHSPNQGRA